jgi:PIN domain nuclease of toxin-antitoxin system
MKYLLDTCTYIWIITNQQDKLTDKIRKIFPDKNNEIYISIISQIETTIKHSKKPITNLSMPIVHYFTKFRNESEIDLLNLTPEDINHLGKLPKIHQDPFDRLLIAQAISNNMTLISPDKKFQKYPVKVEF